MTAHWARPGVKVVCLRTHDYAPNNEVPRVGCIYKIRRVRLCRNEIGRSAIVGITLVGIHNSEHDTLLDGPGELHFRAEWFKPLVTRTQSQDIAEHFQRHLTQPVDVAPLDIPNAEELVE